MVGGLRACRRHTSIGCGVKGLNQLETLNRLLGVGGTGSQAGWRFTRDGGHLASMHNAGAPTQRLVFGPGTDELLAWHVPSRWFAHTDERGSVVALTDDGGNLVRINRYDEYGRPNPNNWGWIQYTGQQWMNDVPIYYYKARFYQPEHGRFMQRDPIGYDDGPNLYNYVHGDPINGTDTSGTTCNAQLTVCWSDNYGPNAARVNVVHTPAQTAVATSSMSRYQLPNADGGEHTGIIRRMPDGSLGHRRLTSSQSGTDTAATARLTFPANTAAIIHGHLQDPSGNTSIVDVPEENGGYGDTQSLEYGRPTFTVADERLGVHDAPGGHLRFEMKIGTMTEGEALEIQENLNRSQTIFNQPRVIGGR